MKHLEYFKKVNESKDSNLVGFKRKLSEIVNDEQVDRILELIPDSIIMPLFYKGDKAKLKSNSKKVEITDIGYKNRQYIYYYYNLDDDEVYSYEDEFIHLK